MRRRARAWPLPAGGLPARPLIPGRGSNACTLRGSTG